MQETLGEPARGATELEQLFTKKKGLTEDTIITASIGWSAHGLVQFKILRGLRNSSRTWQSQHIPRVNLCWSTWLPLMVKWLDLWTRGDRRCNLSHLKQGFQSCLQKNPCTEVRILQSALVDNHLGKKPGFGWWHSKGNSEWVILHLQVSKNWSAAGVCGGIYPVQHLYQQPGEGNRTYCHQACRWHQIGVSKCIHQMWIHSSTGLPCKGT